MNENESKTPVSHEERLLIALESIATSWREMSVSAYLISVGVVVCAAALVGMLLVIK